MKSKVDEFELFFSLGDISAKSTIRVFFKIWVGPSVFKARVTLEFYFGLHRVLRSFQPKISQFGTIKLELKQNTSNEEV